MSHALNKTQRKAIAAEIAKQTLDRAAELKAMDPIAKAEMLRKEAQERQDAELRAMRLDETKVGDVLAEIAKAFRGRRPATPEELERHRWENSTKPSLAARGLPERLLARITTWKQPAQEDVFRRAKAKLKGNGAIVALCGARGVGKSTIAAQIMRERMEAALSYSMADLATRGAEPPDPGRYEKLTRLGTMFKALFAGFGSVGAEALAGRYLAWGRVPLLVLDEVHDAEAIAPTMAMLIDLIDQRYAANRDTILISNRSPDEFREQMNPSIISRLGEHGGLFRCSWESWRVQR